MKKKILIVGGTGFIGHNLSIKLLKSKYKIISISRKKPKNLKKIEKVHYKIFDITKKKNFNKLKGEEFDFVINLGGNIDHQNKKETFKSHYIGLKNLLNFFKNNNKITFIQVGSSLEYGNVISPQKEKNTCEPKSFYGKTKFKASKLVISKAKKTNFKYIILRPYQIYGPHQKFDRLIPYVIKSCLKNIKFKCSDGEQLRDFLYIDDFVSLIIKLINKKNLRSGIYNIGYGKPIKVKSIIENIQKKIRAGKPLFGTIKMRKDEIKKLYPKIDKIKKRFNWKPKFNIQTGLNKTINFYDR